MPTYEYECKKCASRFERFQSMTAGPVKKCPECKGSVRRVINAGTGIILKGSGFYQTDYKNSGSSGKDTSVKGAPACGKSDKCSSCET